MYSVKALIPVYFLKVHQMTMRSFNIFCVERVREKYIRKGVQYASLQARWSPVSVHEHVFAANRHREFEVALGTTHREECEK